MWCHLLFLVPVAGLGFFWILPWPAASVLYVVVVLPSVLIGWAGWRALLARPATGSEAMVGGVGKAITDVAPVGQVCYQDSLWTARAAVPIRSGEPVRIEAVEGLRLRVTPKENSKGNGREEGEGRKGCPHLPR